MNTEFGKSLPQKPNAPSGSSVWLVAALIMLSMIPLAGGAFRLTQLANGAMTTANARFFAAPVPVVLHILSASVYAILGAFQFVPNLRRRRNAWHRTAGWLLIPFGLLVGLSGLWMTLFYPWPAGDGVILYWLRLLFGSGLIVTILLGVAAIQRREFAQHGDWMLRGYAIGMGAGTQALLLMIGEIVAGKPSELSRALLMGAAWLLNLAIAEWIIHRKPSALARMAATAAADEH